MNQADRELFFEENLFKSTLSKLEREKLIPSLQGNHKRSLIGQKWFYFGETTDEYSLYHDQIVDENDSVVFIHLFADGELLTETLIAIDKKELSNRYPIQGLFPKPMEEWEAKLILKHHFSNQ